MHLSVKARKNRSTSRTYPRGFPLMSVLPFLSLTAAHADGAATDQISFPSAVYSTTLPKSIWAERSSLGDANLAELSVDTVRNPGLEDQLFFDSSRPFVGHQKLGRIAVLHDQHAFLADGG